MKILNQLIIGAGLLATASPVLATGKTETTGERPNILFILSDDHSSQAWGIYGGILRDYVKNENIPPPGSGRMCARQLFLYELDLRTQPCCDHDRRL